jgi:LPS-assembly protein
MRMSGMYNYKNPRWKIDGLRHLVTPRLSYRYVPEAERGARYIPPIDRRSFSGYLQPLGLGDTRHIDDLHGTNTLRLGFDNTLQTRDPVYGSRDLVVLNVANDFRFDRRPGERNVSEIHTELAIMPARWLELGIYQRFVPQDFRLNEFNTGITIRDGDVWRARFSSNFLRGELNDYFLEGSRRFNEVFDGIVHLRYDARRQRFNEQSYGIRHNIGNTWRIDYLITLYDGPRRESRFGFNVRVDAIRF